MSEAAKKRRSFSMAYLLAQCAPVVAMPAGQPPTPDSAEKYSYNGVVLPKLPEWDMEMYPYAVILRHKNNGICTLFCTPSEPKLIGAYLRIYTYVSYKISDNAWVYYQKYDKTASHATAVTEAIWANTDIYKEDGTIHLTTSEPVPVYE